MTIAEIEATIEHFRRAARLALNAGFDLVEVHGAHGYLLHSFCSPLSNQRKDEYGGALDNRLRFPLAVARGVREEEHATGRFRRLEHFARDRRVTR